MNQARRGLGRLAVCALMGVAALGVLAASAEAVEVELWPESSFELKQYRDIDRLKIDRTRFSETLTLNLYESGEKAQHAFYTSLRVEFDVGNDRSPDADTQNMAPHSYALLYAYYQGRRLGDLVDLAIGRQLVADELGFCSFDGARLTLYRDFFLGIDLYAGSQIKRGLSERRQNLFLPNSDAFEPDGVKSTARFGGVYGAALFLNGVKDTQLRVQYRRYDSGRSDAHTLGLAFRQRLFGLWELYTVTRMNLLMERPEQLDFGTRLDFGWIRLALDHESRHAYFDGSSIFNFFDVYGTKRLAVSLFIAPDAKTGLNLRYAHQHQGSSFPLFNAWGHRGNAGDEVGIDLSRGLPHRAEVHGGYQAEIGWGGDTHSVHVGGSIELLDRRWRLAGDFAGNRFSRLLYTDMLERNRNSGFSYGFTGASTVRLTEEISLTTEAAALSGPYIERQFRFFGRLEVHAWM